MRVVLGAAFPLGNGVPVPGADWMGLKGLLSMLAASRPV
jgi:hypothetical protein